MNLSLTKWQTDQLTEFFDIAEHEAAQGRPGIIYAQIIRDTDGAHMAVMFADKDTALKMQAATGHEIGKMVEGVATVLCPLDDSEEAAP